MEYTPMELKLLSALQRTDFKNLSKHEFISYTTKLGEMRPEVAKDIIAQFPQLATLMDSTIHEYMGIVDKFIAGEEEILKCYYDIAGQGMENDRKSREHFYDLLRQVREALSKRLENPNLSPMESMEIYKQLSELVRIANEKDTEIRDHEREIEDKSNKKETEKRGHDWKILSTVGVVCVCIVGIGAGMLGGKFDLGHD